MFCLPSCPRILLAWCPKTSIALDCCSKTLASIRFVRFWEEFKKIKGAARSHERSNFLQLAETATLNWDSSHIYRAFRVDQRPNNSQWTA
jgi:hypothetical protein